MKKILTVLCMLTCVLGLTACASESAPTQLEQQKGERAVVMATDFIVPYMTAFFDDEVAAQYQENYNVHELEAMTEDQFAYVLYLYSNNGYSYDFSEIDVEGNAVLSAITSFNSGYDTLGDIDTTENLTGTYEVSGDEIIVTVPLTGTATDAEGKLRTAEVELIFTNDVFLTVESCTLNLQQSVGELMGKAGMDTLMGMGTVFSVLILICLIIALFGFIPKLQESLSGKKSKKEEMQTIKTEAVNNTIAQIIEKEESAEAGNDTELVAVIAAAIAAYEGAAGTDGFVVRSIRKRR